MVKAVVATISCLLIAVCFSGVADAEPQQWKIGHVRPSGSAVDKDIQAFVQQIKAETQGAIRIDIYPGSKLGDYSVVQERVSFGEVQMFVGPFGTAIDKRLALGFTPFLVSTWDEAKTVYAQGSALFDQMAEFLEAQNIKLIGGWPVYFGGIALTKKPPEPGNPDIAKEMIIRVPPIRSFERTARVLGYTPYPITWTYAKMGLKTGMVEGILGGGAEGYLGLKGVIKYYLPIRDHFEYWFVYMNLDLWNSLSEKTKTLFNNLSREMEIKRYAVAEAEERDSIDKLAKIGVEIINIDEKEHALMKEKVRKTVWPEMREEIGEVFEEITH
ncbi:MAG: TRAP transporter substrate-binding protein DctP [Desulfobacterales bacterium]|jgi:TRAP-type C4-dicarboxylate transport system substrate-binding protein